MTDDTTATAVRKYCNDIDWPKIQAVRQSYLSERVKAVESVNNRFSERLKFFAAPAKVIGKMAPTLPAPDDYEQAQAKQTVDLEN